MSSEIVQMLLSSLFSLAGAGLGVLSTSKLTNYRLEQLEKKVDKISENDQSQRVALLEQRMDAYEKARNI